MRNKKPYQGILSWTQQKCALHNKHMRVRQADGHAYIYINNILVNKFSLEGTKIASTPEQIERNAKKAIIKQVKKTLGESWTL